MRLNSALKTATLTACIFSILATVQLGARAAVWSLSGALGTHDPSIIKEGSTWWLFETSGAGIGVKYSANGHAWTQGVSIFGGGLSSQPRSSKIR